MKTLITKTGQKHKLNWASIKKSHFFLPFVFLLLSFVLSSSTPIPSDYQEKKDDGVNKRLMLLEKLEAGKDLNSEEIRSSFNDFRLTDYRSDFICPTYLQEINNQICEEMKEMKKNIETFHNSEEFISMHEELLKWNEKFKEEFEKMMQEFRQTTLEKKFKDRNN